MRRVVPLIFVAAFAFLAVAPGNQAILQVSIWDDTQENPLPKRSEVWIRGEGSWYFHEKATEFGGHTKDIKVPVGNERAIHVYPDGRERDVHIKVPFRVTSEMCHDGCARDDVTVSVTDTTVSVYGNPVEAATGNFEVTRER